MMKKLIALLLALLTLASFAACSKDGEDGSENLDSFKEEEVVFTSVTNEYGTFHFEALDSDTVVITKYEGSTNLHEVVVPSSVQTGEDAETTTKTVAAIGEGAFKDASAITKLTVPEGITTIGKYAFAGCVQMASVVLPSTLSEIAEGAFRESGLTKLELPATCGITEIKASVYSGCERMTEIVVPGYIKTIGQGAFYGCTAATTIVLSEGVVEVGAQAFQGTTALASLTLPSTFTNTDPMADLAFSGSDVLYRENITCPAGSAAEAYADKMVLATAPETNG